MPYIIAEPCVGTCDTACVEVCPVDCIHGPYDKEGAGAEAKADGFVPKEEDSLYIDPEECIDCALCEPECPVDAIFSEDELPDDQIEFIEINAELSEVWPNITEEKEQLPEADEFAEIKDKKHLLER